jgi:hypothetical protein
VSLDEPAGAQRLDIQAFLNPTSAGVTLRIADDEAALLVLFGADGRMVLQRAFAAGQVQIKPHELTQSGLFYFYVRTEKGGFGSGKLVRE